MMTLTVLKKLALLVGLEGVFLVAILLWVATSITPDTLLSNRHYHFYCIGVGTIVKEDITHEYRSTFAISVRLLPPLLVGL